MDPKNALAMVQSAPFAELDPKGLTANTHPCHDEGVAFSSGG